MSTGRLYLDRRIGPGRSLSPRGLVWLLAALLVWNLLIAAFLLLIGAYPVPIFLGLDLLGVVIAFRVSNARAARGERVRVDAERVRVTLGEGAREAEVWSSPTAFTSVAVHAFQRGPRVQLRLSGRALTVGAGLGGRERAAFARDLQAAVRAARAERW